MKRKLISVLLCSAMVISMLAGCGKETQESAEPAAAEQEQAEESKTQETEATDIESLTAITKKEAYEMNSVYSHLYFSTAIDLKVLNIFMPVVWVKVGDIDAKYSITSIEFDCKTGALASIESRKVINI